MAPDDPAFTALIENHLGYACSIALKLQELLPRIDLVDMLQAAKEGLIRAARKYDPHRGVKFTTFSRYFIRGRILDLARLGHGKGDRVHNQTVQFVEGSDSDPTWGEKANSSTMDGADYDPPAPFLDPGEALDGEALARVLHQAIDSLAPDLQHLIELRYLEDKPWLMCIERLRVTANRAYVLHREALAVLRSEDRLTEYMTKTLNQEKTRIDRALLKSVVDELGVVQERIAKAEATPSLKDYKDDKKREGELKDHLKTCLPKDLAGEETHSFDGERFMVNISEARNERYVVDGGWEKIMGFMKKRFTLFCSIPMKALDIELTEEQKTQVIRKGHVGYRSYETERLKKEQRIAA
jgi:RNA polymerase sigma factor (sigma-70 family)